MLLKDLTPEPFEYRRVSRKHVDGIRERCLRCIASREEDLR